MINGSSLIQVDYVEYRVRTVENYPKEIQGICWNKTTYGFKISSTARVADNSLHRQVNVALVDRLYSIVL